MRYNPQSGITDLIHDEKSRRRCGRLEAEQLMCEYGHVLDLSADGLRVVGRHVPDKGPLKLVLYSMGRSVVVKVRVAWARKTGFLRWENGLEFVELTPEIKQQLTVLATNCRKRRQLS